MVEQLANNSAVLVLKKMLACGSRQLWTMLSRPSRIRIDSVHAHAAEEEDGQLKAHRKMHTKVHGVFGHLGWVDWGSACTDYP